MRFLGLLSLILLLTIVIGSIVGCGRSEKFGEEITVIKVTKIKDILIDPDKYVGKTIRVEGKIIRECPSGCWFYLKDDTGTIYVNLHASGFTIPQRVGAEVVVEGELKSEEERKEIVGKGVEIR